MSNKVKGTLLGILASFVGVAVWIALYVGLNIVAGVAGALMGYAFIFVYFKLNPNDSSKYPYFIAVPLAICEVVFSELISIVIICAINNVSLSDALNNSDVLAGIARDLILGCLLSCLVLFCFIRANNTKRKQDQQLQNYTSTPVEITPDEVKTVHKEHQPKEEVSSTLTEEVEKPVDENTNKK